MKSSSGEHFIALDHVRGIAVFLVFSWHFMHWSTGYPVPFQFTPPVIFFPLAILDEGHTGVALFMTLSGYLFAKLLDGKQICFRSFFWNRFLRLVPLYSLVLLIVGLQLCPEVWTVRAYLGYVASGLLKPELLPAGGFSIAAEALFYVFLPLLLWINAKSKWALLVCLTTAMAFRTFLNHRLAYGEFQILAYATLVGRLDQFLCGIMAFQYRKVFIGRHKTAGLIGITFAAFYWWFDRNGGFHQLKPSLGAIWIILPTIEGAAFGSLIAYYDSSFSPRNGGFSRILGRVGTYSYSIYLLHFFFVTKAAAFIHVRIMDISNFYLACLWSLPCFSLMVALGYLSFTFFERPFLKFRKKYTVARNLAVWASANAGDAAGTDSRTGG